MSQSSARSGEKERGGGIERWAHAPVKHLADVAPGLQGQQRLDHVQVRQVQLVVERLLHILVGNKNTLCSA